MASLPGQDAIALMRSTASLHYLFTPTLALPLEGEGTLEIECPCYGVGLGVCIGPGNSVGS